MDGVDNSAIIREIFLSRLLSAEDEDLSDAELLELLVSLGKHGGLSSQVASNLLREFDTFSKDTITDARCGAAVGTSRS
jgi:DNA repair protein RadC